MDTTRKEDIKVIEKGLKDKDPNIRREARVAGDRIKAQMHDPKLVRMRKELVKQTRSRGNVDANNVREDLQNYEKAGYGNSKFTIRWQPGQYESIFDK